MICTACKRAGQTNATGENYARAEKLHEKCEYPGTCPCHHQTDLPEMRPLRADACDPNPENGGAE